MLALKRRLGAPILLSFFSLITILVLLRNPDLSTHLAKIPHLKTIWNWGSDNENDFADGVRLVVLGDSWVDNHVEKGQEGRGRRWTDVLCLEVRLLSYPILVEFCFLQPRIELPC